MRNQWLSIELALGNELQRFLAIATVNAAVLDVQIARANTCERDFDKRVLESKLSDTLRLIIRRLFLFSCFAKPHILSRLRRSYKVPLRELSYFPYSRLRLYFG